MADISSLSEADASNTSLSGVSVAEGCPPSSVNDAIRAMAGMLKRDWDKKGPAYTAGGTANALTLTPTVALGAYVQGELVSFIAGATNTGAVTINISGLGTKAIRLANAALIGGEIVSGRTYMLGYDGTAFQMLSPPGTARGGLIGVQIFTTAGTSTYTPTVGATTYVAEVVAAGGGGGGCATTGAGQASAGGCGGGGGYARKKGLISAISGATITVGAKGTGGTAGANNGAAGGTSSIGAVVSATGGGAGGGGAAVTPPNVSGAAGAGGAGSSGDINITGMSGGNGPTLLSTAVQGTDGGAAPVYGRIARGGFSVGAAGAGTSASGFGNGDTGARCTASQTQQAGGDGTDGLVIIWEYS